MKCQQATGDVDDAEDVPVRLLPDAEALLDRGEHLGALRRPLLPYQRDQAR
jgi:hypothetical protein